MVTSVLAATYLWLWHAQRREKWEYAAAHFGEPQLRPEDRWPRWSLDGRTIYFTSNRGLGEQDHGVAVFAVSSDGLHVRRITPWGYGNPSQLVSRRLLIVRAFASRSTASHYLLDVTTGQMLPIAVRSERSMAFGHSEGELLVAMGADEGEAEGIYRFDLRDDGTVSGRKRLWRGDPGWGELAVSPDGNRVATSNLFIGVVDISKGREIRSFSPPLDDTTNGWIGFFGDPLWLGNSSRLVACGPSGPVLCDVATGEVMVPDQQRMAAPPGWRRPWTELLERDPEPPSPETHWVPCPDGSDRMVFEVARRRGPDMYGLYLAVANLDGSDYRQITTNRPRRVPYVFEREQKGVPEKGKRRG